MELINNGIAKNVKYFYIKTQRCRQRGMVTLGGWTDAKGNIFWGMEVTQ